MPVLGSVAITTACIGSRIMCGSGQEEGRSSGKFFRILALYSLTSTLYRSIDRLVTMMKLKSSPAPVKLKACTSLAFGKESLISSAAESDMKIRLITHSSS